MGSQTFILIAALSLCFAERGEVRHVDRVFLDNPGRWPKLLGMAAGRETPNQATA
jgi:hypothetical protein